VTSYHPPIPRPHSARRPSLRVIGVLAWVVFLTVSGLSQLSAAGPDSPVLRVGLDVSARPFSYVDEHGRPAGFCVDLLDAIGRDQGLRFEYVPLPWSDALAQFGDGKLDLLANLTRTPERTRHTDFSTPHVRMSGALFIRENAPRVHSHDDLRALRIAVSSESLAHVYLRKRGLDKNLLLVADMTAALTAVQNGDADAALTPRTLSLKTIRDRDYRRISQSGLSFPELTYTSHLAVRHGRTELLYTLNLGLHNLRENGTYTLLYSRWLGPIETLRESWQLARAHWLTIFLITTAIALVFFLQRRLLRRLRRQTEALKTSEERLTLALEGSEDAFWDWDILNGRVNRSERWAQILGCRPDEIAPQIDALAAITHPDDLERVEQSKRNLMRDGHGRVEYRLRAHDGTWRWIFDRGKVVARDSENRPARVTGAATDITLRKRIEAALVRSQALLEQTQQAAGMGGWEYDLRTRTIFWTKETWRIHDLPPADEPLPEERVFDFCAPHSREIFTAAVSQAITEGQAFDLELEIITATSRLVWVRCIGRIELAGEKVARLFGSLQDITRNKKADEDRQKLQLKMLEAQKLESLGVLAGGIAHDFNNLLTVIMGNASLARATNGTVSAEALEHIETASNRAADLCRQMLSYAGKSRFSLEGHDLNALIQDTTHLFKTSIAKNAVLEFSLSPAPLQVEIDASQIRQVIMNLVINASDAIGTAPGKIRVRSFLKAVTADQMRDARIGQERPPGDYIILEVEDDGCGMSAETITRIFDPFFTTKFTGRGLGLAAVLGIVRAHRGAFFVRSTLGKGTTFTLALPPATGAVATQVKPVALTFSPAEKADGTILIVDDEPQVRKIAASILEKQGYVTALASDGYEALALALAHGMRFKAVLLDLTMPGLDGPATLRELRALSKTVPVLIMSGYSETDARKHIIAAPLVGFIPKPFTADDLLVKIKALTTQAEEMTSNPPDQR
jgi:two-component system cell cycle sensor histidine kinase/response regulator CckA